MLRLNLASGTDIKQGNGWVNLDVVAWPMAKAKPDVIWNAKDPIPYADNTVDEIYCGYTFLHIPINWHNQLLTECRRVLKVGGLLVIGEVDMGKLMPRWLAAPGDKYLSGLIWGEQGDIHGEAFAEWDKHNQGFTEDSLRAFLFSGGFHDARRIWIHSSEVWYEMTMQTFKEV